MTIVQRRISLIVSQEGQQVLGISASLPASEVYPFVVNDTDDLGLWVKVQREGREHLVLIRWEYILSMDLEVGEGKELGFK